MDDKQKKIRAATGRAYNRLRKTQWTCLAPSCSQRAIESHSQSMASLRTIAEWDHVFAAQTNIYQVAKSTLTSVPIVRTPIRNASTAPIFCERHDNDLFAAIEKKAISHNDPEQAYLFFFRAQVYEFAVKRQWARYQGIFLEEAAEYLRPEIREGVEAVREGQELYVNRDGPYYVDRGWSVLASKEFRDLVTVWRIVPANIGVSATCCMSPLLDQNERHMLQFAGAAQPSISVSIVPTSTETHVVASWFPEIDRHCDWITFNTSNDDGLEYFFNLVAFSESDNACIRPSIWEATPEAIKRRVYNAIMPNAIRANGNHHPRVIRLPTHSYTCLPALAL